MKSLDPYLSFPLSNWITQLVNTEKTRKEHLFIPRALIQIDYLNAVRRVSNFL